MKRKVPVIPLMLVLFLSAFSACSLFQQNAQENKIIPETEEITKDVIENRAIEVLNSLKDMDMEKLSGMIDPDKGVRFSPYGHVNKDTDLVFTADQIKNISNDNTLYTWGVFDGSGAPINLIFSDYYKKFIWDQDFTKAKEAGYNKILGKGNIINNSFDVYPKAIIVEYHFPGFDPQYGGMDWRSLRLVFEKNGDVWYIAGIIHDQWTI